MSLAVDVLGPQYEEEYAAFSSSDPHHLIHYSLAYRKFLERTLEDSEARYLIARDDKGIAGALPLFVKRNARHGNVVNSLPFYGSHGGVLLRPGLADRERVGKALLSEYFATAAQARAVAATLIDNPFESSAQYFPAARGRVFGDERIGQLLELPQVDEAGANEALFARFHHKTRNAVRKGMKSGFAVSHDGSAETVEFLAGLHQENIASVGGLAKPRAVFRAIAESFKYDDDYRIYVARKDGVPVSALLVLFYNRSVEYFTPATRQEFRELQPMNLLIFEVMREAVRRGCLYWNWGGTWKTQEGVYQFKKRWGSIDRPYRYHIDILDPEILSLSRERLLAEYPYYYVAPFDQLVGV